MSPILLNQDEQAVYAVKACVLPTLTDAILILIFAPTLMMFPWLVIHFAFRRTYYVITTQRVLVLDAGGVIGEARLSDIDRIRGSRSALMLMGADTRLWLPRLPDAWHFEGIITRVMAKVGHRK